MVNARLSETAFSGVELGDIEYGINDKIKVRDYYNDKTTKWKNLRINYSKAGKPFIKHRNQRYYLDEFMRVDKFV